MNNSTVVGNKTYERFIINGRYIAIERTDRVNTVAKALDKAILIAKEYQS